MNVDFSSVAFAVRRRCASAGISLPLGHVQEITAAALGYRTLAAFQASSSEGLSFAAGSHILLDIERLLARAKDFGVSGDDTIVQCVVEPLRNLLPGSRVHLSDNAFNDAVRNYVQSMVLNSERVTSEMAMTNGSLGEIYLPFDDIAPVDLADDGDPTEIPISGHVNMDQNWDKAYWGHHIGLEVLLSLTKVGNATIAEPSVSVLSAKLDWGGESDEPRDIPIAHALSDELGIDEEEAALLDYETTPITSSDDLIYGYVLEFSERNNPPDILDKIRRAHPNLSIRVSPNFFDRIKREE
jgi:hypothetical protein